MIYLASQSPRRQELLRQIGVPFQLLPCDIDETPEPGEPAADYVERMALEKARAGWQRMQKQSLAQAPVLAADTTVVLERKILGKPRNPEDACDMLLSLSGKSHEVMTAVAIIQGEQISSKLSVTQVRMGHIDQAWVAAYVATGEPADKAGAYGIQGYGAVLVQAIAGSYSGVVGLPLKETADLLHEFGISPWHT
ncbi:MAG: Maf family protein [Endozoicomonas sp.]